MREKFTNPILQRLIDWGPIAQPAEETNDWKTSALAADFLQREHTRPFFLACGIYHPHLPWYLPENFFDQHPLDSVELPPHLNNDLDDVPPIGRRMAEQSLGVIRDSGQLRSAVHARLASMAFADACVGHVLQSLENSRYRDNTIVVLWGAHGYDVGEKKFAKSTLWQITSRTSLIIQTPDGHQGRCSRPVSLVDLYPTLVDLCGLPPNTKFDGRSLSNVLIQIGPTRQSSHILHTDTGQITQFGVSGFITSATTTAERNCTI